MTPDADPPPLAATQGDETAVSASTSVRGGSGAQNGAEGFDQDAYDWEDDPGCLCGSDDCIECGTPCTWCDGDRIGDGCHDPIQCCGEDYCHPCSGTGLRSQQRVF